MIVQFPNIPLMVWMVATALRWLVRGGADTVLGVIAAIALIIWACGEVVRGINPWRRLLGAAVLGIALLTWS